MSLIHSKTFKYVKNLVIGVGASIVMLGALYKIQNWEGGDIMITAGLVTEAIIFFILGVLPPEKDYYWEKLYPGIDSYEAGQAAVSKQAAAAKPLDGEVVENRLGGMLSELQSMSKSLGSLKALQEVDFSKTKDQIQSMGDFYSKMNEAMENMQESVEDTKRYKDQMEVLNKNLKNLNAVYGNVLNAMTGPQGNS